jgi:hypothetical protein
MLRIFVITVIMLAAADHFMSYGRYTSDAMRASSEILHHFRVL